MSVDDAAREVDGGGDGVVVFRDAETDVDQRAVPAAERRTRRWSRPKLIAVADRDVPCLQASPSARCCAAGPRRSACRSSCWPAATASTGVITSPHIQKTGLALAGFHEYLQAGPRPDLRRERDPLPREPRAGRARRRAAAGAHARFPVRAHHRRLHAAARSCVVEAERARLPLLQDGRRRRRPRSPS